MPASRPSLEDPPPPTKNARATRRLLVASMIVVAVIVVISHGRALRSQALCIDDRQYFTENVLVQNPGLTSVWRALSEVGEPSTVEGYYHPLALISLMVDYAAGAREWDLTIAHVDSLLLHLLTTICVMLLIHQLFRNAVAAAMAAVLFGVHPLTVELAVWISQRKAGLAGLFTAVCLLCYVIWIRRRNAPWYAASLAALVLALLAKPSALPAPVLLLVLDFWPLHRLRWKAVTEKIPHFAIAAAAGAISVISNMPTVGFGANATLSLAEKAMLACVKLGFFVEKVFLPRDLTVFYVPPQRLALDQPMVVQGIVIVAVMVAIALISLRWTRAPAACLAFFLVALGPVLGFVGYSEVFAFDSYAYIALIALALLVGAAMNWLTRASTAKTHVDEAPPLRPLPTAIAGAAVLIVSLAFIIQNYRYLAHWSDTERLYVHMIRLAPRAPVLHKNLGNHYFKQGDYLRAQREFEVAFSQFPSDWQNHVNLAAVWAARGQEQQARQYLKSAAETRPTRPADILFLTRALLQAGLPAEALELSNRLLALRPNSAAAFLLSGDVHRHQRNMPQALEAYRRATELESGNPAAHFAYGTALSSSGRTDEARRELQETLRLDPRHSSARAALDRLPSAK